ncbi:uncharacterized protein EAF02_011604 [Botrytis sinoallii]|uniref:uncharacterized protein n=1 Tax=Botrytis sinoallii TaxID=1463999 RepID=UPI0018FF3FBF|nr:uncharacterized protein EAF02_011604 [Botrytis sinoallii]KAF7854429.1 hypothetical protein EAF02_011604 [Botrytis sinoallii]
MQASHEETFKCSRGHVHKKEETHTKYCIRDCPDYCKCHWHISEIGHNTQELARRERRVSEREIRVAGEEDRFAMYVEHWNNEISIREAVVSSRKASLEIAEEEFERKKNELLAPKNWFEQIEEWSQNASECAQDGSSYGPDGWLQPTRALDPGERPHHRRSSHGDHPTRPHEELGRPRRASSASHRHHHDSNQPAIRITPPDPNIHSVPNS